MIQGKAPFLRRKFPLPIRRTQEEMTAPVVEVSKDENDKFQKLSVKWGIRIVSQQATQTPSHTR